MNDKYKSDILSLFLILLVFTVLFTGFNERIMQNSKKNKLTKKEMMIMFFMILLFIPLFILIFINENREIDEKMVHYPELYRASCLASRLQDVTKEKGFKNKGTVYIDLYDGTNFSLPYDLRNYEYSPDNLYDFVQKEDSIYKRINSDTIWICRDNKEYYFVLNKIINK